MGNDIGKKIIKQRYKDFNHEERNYPLINLPKDKRRKQNGRRKMEQIRLNIFLKEPCEMYRQEPFKGLCRYISEYSSVLVQL